VFEAQHDTSQIHTEYKIPFIDIEIRNAADANRFPDYACEIRGAGEMAIGRDDGGDPRGYGVFAADVEGPGVYGEVGVCLTEGGFRGGEGGGIDVGEAKSRRMGGQEVRSCESDAGRGTSDGDNAIFERHCVLKRNLLDAFRVLSDECESGAEVGAFHAVPHAPDMLFRIRFVCSPEACGVSCVPVGVRSVMFWERVP
jgi:hypothetical protein